MLIRRNPVFHPHAFTLIEVMIVVTLIGLLAALALPYFTKARDNARLNAIYNNLRQIDSAKEQWAMENNVANGTAVADLSEFQDYLRHQVRDVVHETYVPNPVGTPPVAELPGGVRLGPFESGAVIPAL